MRFEILGGDFCYVRTNLDCKWVQSRDFFQSMVIEYFTNFIHENENGRLRKIKVGKEIPLEVSEKTLESIVNNDVVDRFEIGAIVCDFMLDRHDSFSRRKRLDEAYCSNLRKCANDVSKIFSEYEEIMRKYKHLYVLDETSDLYLKMRNDLTSKNFQEAKECLQLLYNPNSTGVEKLYSMIHSYVMKNKITELFKHS